MAQVPVEIVDIRRARDDTIMAAVQMMNDAQDQFKFDVLSDPKSASLALLVREETEMEAFITGFYGARRDWKGYHPHLIAVFDTPINHGGTRNLFSVDVASDGIATVTTHNVAPVLMPVKKLISYVIFQIAVFSLKFVGGDIPFHDEDRDCIFDYRKDKRGIVRAIQKEHICDDCKRALIAPGRLLSPQQLSAIFALLKLGAKTLTEKNNVTKPASKPRLFIGSSVEGLEVARAIQAELEHDYSVEVWNQSDVFGLGAATLEALEAAVKTYDFGIFVFTPDDEIKMRGKKGTVARDNVIFEAGLFIGQLGRFRTFLVRPRAELQLPTDFAGITVANYDPSKPNLAAAVGTACTKIRQGIKARAGSGLKKA